MKQSSTREYSLEEIEHVTNKFPIGSVHSLFNYHKDIIVVSGPYSTLFPVKDGLEGSDELWWTEKSSLIELQEANGNIIRASLASPFIVYSTRNYATEANIQLSEVING
jgi:hypothetical protein